MQQKPNLRRLHPFRKIFPKQRRRSILAREKPQLFQNSHNLPLRHTRRSPRPQRKRHMADRLTNVVHRIFAGALFAEPEANDVVDTVTDLLVEIGVLDFFGHDVLDEHVRIRFSEPDFVRGWGPDFRIESEDCCVQLGKGDVQ